MRARHGKLKSAKIGRNWMTTKEWLEEYLSHNGNDHNIIQLASAELPQKIIFSPPENLPVEYFERSDFPHNFGGSPTSRHFRMSDILNLRTSFIFVLTSILILAGGVFGKESFRSATQDVNNLTLPARNLASDYLQKAYSNFKEGTAIVNDSAEMAVNKIGGKEIFVGGVSITVGDIAGGTAEIVADYSRWTAQKIKTSAFGKNYIKANNFLEKGLSNDFQNLSSRYIFADNWLGQRFSAAGGTIQGIGRDIEHGYQKFAGAVKNKTFGFVEKVRNLIPGRSLFVNQQEFEKLKSELSELKKTSFIVKRVEVSKVVEPVKEITREVETIKQITKVDDRALAEIRATMAYLEGEIGKRLYAPGGVISQTIYTKEPVSSPKIYQENGEIVLQTLGSGNVILSAATGLQLYGSQVIIESTSKLSPMIYLANNSRIGGDLAVTGTANISGTLGIGGAASVSGNLTVGGNFTVTGSQSFSGPMTISASSTPAVLTITQTGTGDILNLQDGSTEVFTVIDGGNVGIATSTPSSVLAVGGDIMGSGNIILYGNATSALAGPLAITTSTAVYQLQLAYDSSNYTKFITNSSGDLNITPSGEDVTITGNLLVTGSPNYGGGASFLLPLTITTTTVPQLLVRYDADNELNIEISSDGTTLFLATGTDANLELRTENFDNAIFVDDSTGRIGIATTSPRYTFDVWGDVAFGTSTATSSTAIVPAFYVSTGNGPRVGIGTTTLSTNLLTIGTTTHALVVDQLNNTGFGTSTPSSQAKLSVQGNILGSGNIVLYGTATSTINSGLTVGNNGALVVNQAASANSLYIATNGNVGIGTTTPLSRLSVSGDIVLGLQGGYSTSTKISSATSTFAGGFISLASSTIANYLSVGTSTTPTLFVDSGSGYVGIASSTPSTTLSVQGNILGSGNIVIYGTATSTYSGGIQTPAIKLTNGSANNFVLTSDANGYATWQDSSLINPENWSFATANAIRPTSTVGIIVNSSSTFTGDLTAGNNALFVDDAGLVGIGTTTPSSKLTVSGDIELGMANGRSATSTRLSSATSTFAGGFISLASSTIANYLSVGTSTTPTLFVDSGSGYVGIGTAGPSKLLHLYNTTDPRILVEGTTGYSFTEYKNTGGNFYTGLDNSTGGGFGVGNYTGVVWNAANTPLVFATNNTEKVRITTDGNVGIGTTGPSEKLTVFSGNMAVGGGTATTTIRYGATGVATSTFAGDISAIGILAVGDGSATSTIRGASAATSTINSGLTVGNNAALVVNQAASANSLYINPSGNVGIGTAAPGQLLSLQKDQNAQTIARIKNATSGSGAGSQFVVSYADAQYAVFQQVNPSYTTDGLIVANSASLWTNGNTNGLRVLTYDATDLTLGTNNAAVMTLKSGGNVGIGSVSPGEKLTVASGNIAVGDGTATTTIRYGSTGLATSSFSGDLSVKGIFMAGDGSSTSTIRGSTAATSTISSGLTVGNNGALVVNQAASANSLYINPSGNVGIGTTTPYAALTINESSGFAIGSFDENVIDTMEGSHLNWHSSDTTNVATSSEQSIVRVGGQSLKISASGASEDDTVKQTFSANKDWTNYERLGFWIYSDRISTSTATTTQLISFSYHDTGGAESTSTVSIQQEGKWQYQEITLDGTAANKNAVDYIQFRIDFNNLAAINFYIDQIRTYDDVERSAEMFVGRDGSLVVMGRGGVEIGRADGSTGKPGLKVDTAIVQINQPLAVDVGGDVGMNNDLQFMSTGLSQITSEGPLRIAGGDSNHNENLTLTVGGGGNIIAELTNASSTFMVTQAWTASTSIAFIINSETNATNTNGSGMLFKAITDYASDENTVFSVDVSGNIYYDRGAHTPAADVAENYRVEDQSIGAGDVVCFASSAITVEKCSSEYQDNIIGVISTQPALMMSDDLANSKPVALVGRVPVKISLENGTIAVGDPLTSASSTPGMAMKATRAGKILGYALESATSTEIGAILAFMRIEQLGGDLTVSQNETGSLVVSTYTVTGQKTLFSVDETGAVVVGKLKAQELCVGSVCVTETDFMRVFGAEASPPAGGEASTTTATSTEPVIIPDLPDSVIDSGPAATTTSTEATFIFHSTKANSTFSCQLEDGSMWAGCDSPKIYAGLSVGNHQFSLQAIDASGQSEPTPSIYNWQIIATSTDSMATTTP